MGTSLAVQWVRICLPMQRTRVLSLVWEDSTCQEATKPRHHNYWACAPQQEKPPPWEAYSHQLEESPHLLQLEEAHARQWRPKKTNFLNCLAGPWHRETTHWKLAIRYIQTSVPVVWLGTFPLAASACGALHEALTHSLLLYDCCASDSIISGLQAPGDGN